jgi:hypothetical protein
MPSEKYVVLSLISAIPERHHGCHIIREGELFPMIYHIVYGPRSYWECSEWLGFHCTPIPRWWDDEKADALKAMEEIQAIKDKHPTVRPYETRKVEIGHINGVPEVKIEWEGKWIKYPVIYHRDSKLIAYAEFAAPDLHTIWGDITGCAAGAAAVATLAAIIASPAAALPAFKAAFMACIVPKIGERAKEISVALSTHQEHGDWHRV